VRLSPSTETFAVTYVTVSGLAPLTAYTFQVYSENGVSKVSFHRVPPATQCCGSEAANF
jgi:hypothetical protein